MTFKTFDEFLQNKHFELHPMLLDDDLSDAFDNWMGSLEQEDLIELAEEAIKQLTN